MLLVDAHLDLAMNALEWDRNLDLVLRTVEEEDFPTGEGIQAGFRAGAQAEVVYGRNEPALQHWQRTVTQALAKDARR